MKGSAEMRLDMIYKQFQDIKLSRLGMGNMRLPVTWGKIDKQKAQQIIDYAMEQGINYYDTAYVYHHGESESFLGTALSRYPRENYYLATKFYVMANPNIEKVFEEQLRRLHTDYIDFYLLHCVNEETIGAYQNRSRRYMDYLLEQKAKGRIRHIGFSSHGSPATLERFLNWSDAFEFVQIQLNFLDWTLQNAKKQYEIITEHGLPVWVMEPVRGGRLASLGEKYDSMLKKARPDWSVPAWAFHWLMGLDNVTMILSGMSSFDQIRDNVATFQTQEPLTREQNMMLMNIAAGYQSKLAVPCTACRYCCDGCPKGIDIPEWMNLYNELALTNDKKTWENAMQKSAGPSACVSCGQCTSHCPQKINVPGYLKKMESWPVG